MVWVYMVILLLTFALMPSPLAKDPYTTSEMARTSRTDAWISTGRPFSADPAPPCLLSHHPRDWAPGASPPAPSGSCPQRSSSLLAMSVLSASWRLSTVAHWHLGSGSTCNSGGETCCLLLAFSEAVASPGDFMYMLKGREEVCYVSQQAYAVPDLQEVIYHHS